MSGFDRTGPGVYAMGQDNLPCLVFLHGWLGSAEDWQETAGHLSTCFRCVALDLPGHGAHGNQAEGTGSLDEAVDWLTQRLSELPGQDPFVLVGYSLGGRLATEVAARKTGRVKGLVLMSARPGMPDAERESRKTADQTWSAQIRENWDRFLQTWYAQPMFNLQDVSSEKVKERIQRRSGNHPAQAAETLVNWSPAFQQDRLPWLVDCPLPLLYIAGSKDRKYVEVAESIRGNSKDRWVEILEETGHAVHLDRPQLCANAIEQFIDKNREALWP